MSQFVTYNPAAKMGFWWKAPASLLNKAFPCSSVLRSKPAVQVNIGIMLVS